MKIQLDNPYAVGDLAPNAFYPHVYITTFYVNGPGRSAVISYEIGELRDISQDNPMGTWNKAVEVPAGALQLNGEELYPFFMAQVSVGPEAPYLWDQVEELLYTLIQQDKPRLSGIIG